MDVVAASYELAVASTLCNIAMQTPRVSNTTG